MSRSQVWPCSAQLVFPILYVTEYIYFLYHKLNVFIVSDTQTASLSMSYKVSSRVAMLQAWIGLESLQNAPLLLVSSGRPAILHDQPSGV